MGLEAYRYDIEMCLRCSSCKWIDPMWSKSKRYNKICPISSHFHFDAYSCQGLMDISLALLDCEVGYTDQLADILYHCTLCGACDVMCKRTLDTERLLILEELRRELVKHRLAPQKPQSRLTQAIGRSHNLYGAAHEKRFLWMEGLRKASLTAKAKIVYFVGCTSSYRHPEIAQATIDLLNAAGIEFTVMGSSEWCCGNPLLRYGLLDEAKKVMDHNLEVLQDFEADTVITSCAECYHMWKVDYPRQHEKKTLGYQALHITQLVADWIKGGNLKFEHPVELTVTYHDSCRLGRLSEPHEPWSGRRLEYGKLDPPKIWRRGTQGVYAPPREILQSIPGLRFVEMERVRENGFCCGAGGGVKRVYNDFALATGIERITEAKDTGAQVLASSCPFCKWNFQEAASLKGIDLKIMDVVEIAAQAI